MNLRPEIAGAFFGSLRIQLVLYRRHSQIDTMLPQDADMCARARLSNLDIIQLYLAIQAVEINHRPERRLIIFSSDHQTVQKDAQRPTWKSLHPLFTFGGC